MEGAPRIKSGRFFAEFSVRMFVFWLDLIAVLITSQIIRDYVLAPAGLSFNGIGAIVPFVGFFYFVASWSSPMRATPVQWLFGMRIVDSSGDTLSPLHASLRAAALFGLFFATFTFFGALDSPYFAALALAGYAALFLPAAMFLFVAQMHQQRDLLYRTSYAIEQTQDLKSAVAVIYDIEQRWPDDEIELGLDTRGDYPDGGYYELEADGVIRISFEVKSDLVKGQIILSPVTGAEGVSWECHQEGEIQRKYLPSTCRDR